MWTADKPARIGACLAIALCVLAGCATTPYDQGRRALQDGDTQTALARFDESIASGERVAEATREKAAVRLESGDAEAAIALLEPLADELPDDRRRAWLMGQAYSRADRPAEAAEAYRMYEALTSRRSVRKQVRLRVAQLEAEVDQTAARRLLTQRSDGVPPEPNSVAVFAFTPESGAEASLHEQKMCRALNIWVTADLAKVSRLRTISASQLDLVYEEQNFTYENRQIFVPSSLVRAGNLQPARHMVRGIYGSYPGDQIGMGAACFDVEKNTSDTCSDIAGEEKDLFDLETELVLNLLSVVGVEPTPEERIAIGQKPTRNLDAFLAFADGVYLRDIGNLEAAAAAFAEAAKIDPGFSMAKKYEAATEAEANPATVSVDPPIFFSPVLERAQTSSAQMGLGLIPDGSLGEQQGGGTNGITTVRGDATLRIRAQTGPER